MDENNKAPDTTPSASVSNVLQFPQRKKEGEAAVHTPAPPGQGKPAGNTTAKPATKAVKKRAPKKNVGASVLAVILATVAVNRFVYDKSTVHTSQFASSAGIGRAIASVDRVNWQRDAAWEKDVAESLASPKVRDVASTQVGRPATLEERLRWGTLEEKYTITYRADHHEIDSISFQDVTGNPAYILDRHQFLKEYGKLFNAASTKLKSVEESSDKTIESFTLFDAETHVKGEARFELDRHKRLLSLKVEPTQI